MKAEEELREERARRIAEEQRTRQRESQVRFLESVQSLEIEDVLNLNLDAANITSVVWCIGYGYNFNWIKADIFNDRGLPNHYRGITDENGLYFLGLTWQNTWGSARFSGVAKDAEYLLKKMIEVKEKQVELIEKKPLAA